MGFNSRGTKTRNQIKYYISKLIPLGINYGHKLTHVTGGFMFKHLIWLVTKYQKKEKNGR